MEVKRAEPREIHSIADKSVIPDLQCIVPTNPAAPIGAAGGLPSVAVAAMARQLGLPCTPGIQHVLAAQQQGESHYPVLTFKILSFNTGPPPISWKFQFQIACISGIQIRASPYFSILITKGPWALEW